MSLYLFTSTRARVFVVLPVWQAAILVFPLDFSDYITESLTHLLLKLFIGSGLGRVLRWQCRERRGPRGPVFTEGSACLSLPKARNFKQKG